MGPTGTGEISPLISLAGKSTVRFHRSLNSDLKFIHLAAEITKDIQTYRPWGDKTQRECER